MIKRENREVLVFHLADHLPKRTVLKVAVMVDVFLEDLDE